MRHVYRNKLIQYTQEQKNGFNGQQTEKRVGFDLNAREELVRTYTEKEVDLVEKLEKERKINK